MPPKPPGQPPTLDQVRDTVAELLRIDPADIPEDADLQELGLDSLAMMRVINLWRRVRIRISMEDLTDEPTLAAWARLTRSPAAQSH
ncbi:phosphopantetheine-binding protein [Nocardia nepalensis]|uniref:phosphopantetheine-binding protein n=1 Tax=Nocardia nepalensis TaxID=3375448 RepID=UPI003B682A29